MQEKLNEKLRVCTNNGVTRAYLRARLYLSMPKFIGLDDPPENSFVCGTALVVDLPRNSDSPRN